MMLSTLQIKVGGDASCTKGSDLLYKIKVKKKGSKGKSANPLPLTLELKIRDDQ